MIDHDVLQGMNGPVVRSGSLAEETVRQCAGADVMNKVTARAARCVSQTHPNPTTISRLVAHTVRRHSKECRL